MRFGHGTKSPYAGSILCLVSCMFFALRFEVFFTLWPLCATPNRSVDAIALRWIEADAPSATIIGHPDVRRMLMDMKARVEAMRALAYYTAGQMDRAHGHEDSATRQGAQTLVDLLIPVVKGWCTDSALAITSDGVQIHGGMGFIEETGASQHLRDARITTIYEGTIGIQANDLIGRKLARDSGVAMKRLIAMMGDDIDTASAVAGHDDASLDSIATAQRTGLRDAQF